MPNTSRCTRRLYLMKHSNQAFLPGQLRLEAKNLSSVRLSVCAARACSEGKHSRSSKISRPGSIRNEAVAKRVALHSSVKNVAGEGYHILSSCYLARNAQGVCVYRLLPLNECPLYSLLGQMLSPSRDAPCVGLVVNIMNTITRHIYGNHLHPHSPGCPVGPWLRVLQVLQVLPNTMSCYVAQSQDLTLCLQQPQP
ncbi:hypothetical protein BDV18DRAFT_149650 [Aspergillus unguis]